MYLQGCQVNDTPFPFPQKKSKKSVSSWRQLQIELFRYILIIHQGKGEVGSKDLLWNVMHSLEAEQNLAQEWVLSVVST